MNSRSGRDRIITIWRSLEQLWAVVDLCELKDPAARIANAKHLDAVERELATLREVATARPGHPNYRTLAERVASVIVALEAVTKARGSAMYAWDTLRDLAAMHGPTEDSEFWSAEAPEALWGLIREGTSERGGNVIGAALEERGVLAWIGRDDQVRLVDVHRLTAHADIFRWVVDQWGGGTRCRACGMTERPGAPELSSIDQVRRTGMQAGARQYATGVVGVHARCAPLWMRMVRIAEQYATLEEAQAADEAEGRVSGAPPVAEPEVEARAQPRRKRAGGG